MKTPVTFIMMPIFWLIVSIGLSGCETSHEIDVHSYSPVIDTYRVADIEQYNTDLRQCRAIGQRAQQTYLAERQKEKDRAKQNFVIGALVGAAIGNALDGDDDSGTTVGAAVGALSATDINDTNYTDIMADFGPGRVIDRCMADRGYDILSTEGVGGG